MHSVNVSLIPSNFSVFFSVQTSRSGTKNPDRKRSGGTQFFGGEGWMGKAQAMTSTDLLPSMEESIAPLNSFLIIVQGITSYSLFGQSEV